ncbi:MAG: PPC domain-containing protein [Planctomycetaceae bacterium]|nr:PPC domain-containing protein [Planctomycetaceae bacterium]
MRFFFTLNLVVVFLISSSVVAQQREPKIGYVYPAGGQKGTTFEVLIGGRQIARSSAILISGSGGLGNSGVRGRIVQGYPAMFINNSDESKVARQIYNDAKKQLEENHSTAKRNERKEERKEQKPIPKLQKNNDQTKNTAQSVDETALPSPETIMKRFPFFSRLAQPTPDDLQLIFYEFFAPRIDRKPKETLNQGVLVEITIDPNAEPGNRDLRLVTSNGISPPVRFMVGTIPEINELEPNDTANQPLNSLELWKRREAPKTIRQLEPLDLPIVINGRVRAADVDRFQFKAQAGQHLVIGVRARYLIPYLADAVPGWFQAAIALYSPDGQKMDDAASFRFDPDPILCVDIPKNGVYTLEIQDSIFRGRDDFVYRISIDESPLMTSVFPLGGRHGAAVKTKLDGHNLPEKETVLDTSSGEPGIREKSFLGNQWLPYPIRYAVDELPEQLESEPNHPEKPEKVTLPIIINGQISEKTDLDCFSFEGKKGTRLVLDVAARSLDSPLDASIELIDATGNVIASNDDRADSKGLNIGLETHHADPYLNVELPADGVYTVRLFSATQHGDPPFAYRLRISAPQEDFAVYCEPASLCFNDKIQSLKIHVLRKDGFNGEIHLRLAESCKRAGFQLENERIPAGATEEITAKLSLLPQYNGKPTEVILEAVATINGKEKCHQVIPVDDFEQAFIYHHFVPATSFIVTKPSSRAGFFRK